MRPAKEGKVQHSHLRKVKIDDQATRCKDVHCVTAANAYVESWAKVNSLHARQRRDLTITSIRRQAFGHPRRSALQ